MSPIMPVVCWRCAARARGRRPRRRRAEWVRPDPRGDRLPRSHGSAGGPPGLPGLDQFSDDRGSL